MKRVICLLALCVSMLAQETPKLIEVKNLDITQLSGFLMAFGVRYSGIPGSRLIALNGQKENVIAAEEAIKRMDVPRKNIELTFQIIAATVQADAEKVPADLEPVVKQLKSAFLYQGYRVLETMFVRNREGSYGRATGVMPGPPGGRKAFFSVEFRSSSISTDSKGAVIHLERLQIGGRLPTGVNAKGETDYQNAGIEADVDVREGQKAVVGKSSVDVKDGAIFMVVTAKVVD
jgi:hypothetical protein